MPYSTFIAVKLAPIFGGAKHSTITISDNEDDDEIVITVEEQAKREVRRQFLLSGVPDAMRKQLAVADAIAVPEYAPWPTVSHVQQRPGLWQTEDQGVSLLQKGSNTGIGFQRADNHGISLVEKETDTGAQLQKTEDHGGSLVQKEAVTGAGGDDGRLEDVDMNSEGEGGGVDVRGGGDIGSKEDKSEQSADGCNKEDQMDRDKMESLKSLPECSQADEKTVGMCEARRSFFDAKYHASVDVWALDDVTLTLGRDEKVDVPQCVQSGWDVTHRTHTSVKQVGVFHHFHVHHQSKP